MSIAGERGPERCTLSGGVVWPAEDSRRMAFEAMYREIATPRGRKLTGKWKVWWRATKALLRGSR